MREKKRGSRERAVQVYVCTPELATADAEPNSDPYRIHALSTAQCSVGRLSKSARWTPNPKNNDRWAISSDTRLIGAIRVIRGEKSF